MTDLTVASRAKFEERRRRLRWRKRWQFVKMLWRMLLVGSFTGGLLWFVAQSNWIIRNAEQIDIEGMELLSEETVRALIPVAYPELIIEVDPEAIAQQLKEHGPIETVSIHRQLFPPSLSIHITERRPVALLLGDTYTDPFAATTDETQPQSIPSRNIPSKVAPTGLLDENGNWLPITSYTNIPEEFDLPELRVIGMQSSYRQSWKTLYETLSLSPVEVYEINWQNPANLILNTELGVVHFGPYQGSSFQEQITLLDRMRNLPEVVERSDIAYIDLRDLDAPMLQFHPSAPQYSQTTVQIPVADPTESSNDESAEE